MKNNKLSRALDYARLHPISALARAGTWLAAGITAFLICYLIIYIIARGLPYIKPSLFALKYNSENVSLLPALVNTVIMTLLSLLLAVPLGIFSAIYLNEYAKRGNKLVKAIALAAETLSGIPSIVYGLFGAIFFVSYMNMGLSLIAGACTLAIMILPLIMRTTQEALSSVPDMFREGSYGLGAGRLRTVFSVVLPSAVPSILAGVILAIGRIVGETAALMYTAGTVPEIVGGKDFLLDSARTLSSHMYALSNEGLYTNQAYATAAVLIVLVAGLNAASSYLAKKVTRG